jgi:hypothetical protein
MSREESTNRTNRGAYREKIFKKVYDKKMSVPSGLILRTDHINFNEPRIADSEVCVDDINGEEVILSGEIEADDFYVNWGADFTPDEARELASALYEAANVAETWNNDK